MIHTFTGFPYDGANPYGGLVNVNGTLYGTTNEGGFSCDCGTVFSITPSGTETVLHSFSMGDGSYPTAGLISVNGTLYGTTEYGGGTRNAGTVFSITTSGKEIVLHSFGESSGDGANPYGGLVNVNRHTLRHDIVRWFGFV